MKPFFRQYSYSMVKMFVNQFAISIFGAVLAMATFKAHRGITIAVSVCAIVFYLFLLYTMTWEIGAKDRVSVDSGKKAYRPHTGLTLSLFANMPNFLLALIFTVSYPFMGTQRWAGNLAAIVTVIANILEGMYLGLITSISIGGVVMQRLWWTYFLITVPALLISWLAYYLGYKNIKYTTLFDYKDMSKPRADRRK